MAIEFRCSQCNQLLRVPEEASGKNARCPKCQALMTVPGVAVAMPSPSETTPPASSPPPLLSNPFAGESISSAAPLPPKPSGDNPFSGTTAPADALNPYASPAAAAYAYTPQYYELGGRSGLPWESEPRSISCWFRTMGIVLGSPARAFSIMRQYGGLGTPLLYNLYAVGMLMTLVLAIVVPIGVIIAFAAGANNNQGEFLAGAALIGGFGLLFAVFYAIMITVVTPFIWSAVAHVMLIMYGGARQGFETTFRVICFSYFSVLVPGIFLACVPYIGGLAMGIWAMVLVIIGLSRAHEISGGKATAAVLTPIGVCCGLYLAFAAVFIAGPGIMEAINGR